MTTTLGMAQKEIAVTRPIEPIGLLRIDLR